MKKNHRWRGQIEGWVTENLVLRLLIMKSSTDDYYTAPW